jgi:AraC family transcriptional regulator
MPVLLCSSDALGWDALSARIYHEPPAMESWRPPPVPMLTLGLVMSGAMALEQRHRGAPWHGHTVHPDRFFLQSYHEPYELRWRSGRPETIHTLVLKLHQHAVVRIIEEVADRDPVRIEFVEHIGFDDALLLHLTRALRQELDQPSALGPIYAQTAAQLLGVHLLRQYSTMGSALREPTRGLTPKQVQCVRDVVQDQLAHDLSLAVMARAVHLSPYYFARMFRQATGESPHQFVLRQRLERAQALLGTTTLPIGDIAVMSGFATQSYLTTLPSSPSALA